MKNILNPFSLFPVVFKESDTKIRYQFIFLNSVFFYAGIIAFFMGFVRWQFNPLMGIIDFAFSIICIGLLYYLRSHKEQIEGVSTIALLLTFILFYAIYLFAPYNIVRPSLFFLLSASAFFLKGRQVGLYWTLFILFAIIVGYFSPFNLGYSFFDILFLSICLIGLFFIFDNNELIKEEQKEYLALLNSKLEQTVQKRTKALRQSKLILEESEKRFRSAFDFAAIGMALVSLDGYFLKVNQSLCQITGYTSEELLTKNFQQITFPDDLNADLKHYTQLLNNKIITYQMEKRYICKNESVVWILLSVSLLRDASNKPLYFIAQIQNIDAQKHAEQELKQLAYYDVLTGLANRKQLDQSFKSFVAQAKRYHHQIAILFIDIDGFKQVNDSYGHDVGDSFLIKIATILKNSIRATDTAGRLGGDEFIIILSEITKQDQVELVVKKIFTAFSKSLKIKSKIIPVQASIGVSIYPKDGYDLDTLLKHADSALYAVKTSGKNNFQFYS